MQLPSRQKCHWLPGVAVRSAAGSSITKTEASLLCPTSYAVQGAVAMSDEDETDKVSIEGEAEEEVEEEEEKPEEQAAEEQNEADEQEDPEEQEEPEEQAEEEDQGETGEQPQESEVAKDASRETRRCLRLLCPVSTKHGAARTAPEPQPLSQQLRQGDLVRPVLGESHARLAVSVPG